MSPQTLKQRTLESVFWMFAGSGGQQVANFVIMLVLARELGPAAFGLVGLATVFIDILTIIGRAGLTEVVIQKQEATQTELSTAFWSSMVFGVLLAAALFFSAPLLAIVFSEPELAPVMRWLSISCVFNTAGTVHEGLLHRSFGFKALALRNVTASIVSGGVAIIMVLNGFGVMSLVAQNIVLKSWVVAALWFAVRWFPSFQFSRSAALKQLRIGIALVGSSLLGTGNQKIIDILVGYFLGTTSLGYLRIAFKALDVLFNVCVMPVTSVSRSLLAHLQNDRPAMIRAYLKLVKLTALIIYPVFLGTAVIAPEFIALAFGPKWAPSVPLMQLFTVMAFFVPLAYYRNHVLMAAGHPDQIFLFSVLSFTISVILCVITTQISIEATALGFALRFGFVTPITLTAVRKYVGVPISETLKSVLPPTVASLVMIGILWPLRLSDLMPTNPILSISVTVALGGFFYAGVLFVFFRKGWNEAVTLFPFEKIKLLNKRA